MRPQNLPGRALVVLMLVQTMAAFAQHGPQIVEYKKLTTNDYIARYKEIAIREMERSGIPASITLAQGIHESGNGNSSLAKKANNHFQGIWKCRFILHRSYRISDDQKKVCLLIRVRKCRLYKLGTWFKKGRLCYRQHLPSKINIHH